MIAIILSVLTILAALVPVIVRMIEEKKVEKYAVERRSLDELHAATERLRAVPDSTEKPPV